MIELNRVIQNYEKGIKINVASKRFKKEIC